MATCFEGRLAAPYYRIFFEKKNHFFSKKLCLLLHEDECGHIIIGTSICRQRSNRIVKEKYVKNGTEQTDR